MIKPGSPPSYSPTGTQPDHAEVPAPSSSDITVHPSPPSPLYKDPQSQEAEWQASLLQNLEHQISWYQHHAREGKIKKRDVEGVAQAMDKIAENHTDHKVKAEWKKKAKRFRKASPKEREAALTGVAKGFLILLTSPFYFVWATFHVSGALLNGMGSALKGVGLVAKKMAYTGGSFSKG